MTILAHYSSFDAFLADVKKHPVSDSRILREGLKFHGATFSDAVRLAETGWPEGSKKIADLSANLVDKISSLMEVEHLSYDVTGLDFDMGMHIAGVPESWMNFESSYEIGSSPRILKMVYNFGARAYVDSSVLTYRGVVAASLIQLLEKSNYRVELVAVNRVEQFGSEAVDFHIPVKAADQQIDIDRLAFILAHPSMLRVLGFSARQEYGMGWAQGGSIDIPIEEQGEVYIGAGHGSEWKQPETAQAWILEQLKLQGVHISQEGK